MSRTTIMSVRRTLSETEIEYEVPTLMVSSPQMVQSGFETWYQTSKIPIAVPAASAEKATVSLRMNKEPTERAEVEQAGKSDGPVVHGVNHVTPVELAEGFVLDIRRPSGRQDLPKCRPLASC